MRPSSQSNAVRGRPSAVAAKASQSRLNFRLTPELKEIIERAAGHTGQTVSDFAISTLVRTAHEVIERHDRTELSVRDRDRFVAVLNDKEARPNQALTIAAERYKREIK